MDEKRMFNTIMVDGKLLSPEAVKFFNDWLIGEYSNCGDLRNSLLHVASLFMQHLPEDMIYLDQVRRFGWSCDIITSFADDLERVLHDINTQLHINEIIRKQQDNAA